MTNSENQKTWSKKISEFKKSGKSKEDWCQKNNISLRQFGYWLKYFTKNQTKKWLPVKIKENDICKMNALQLQVPALEQETLAAALPVNSLNIKIGTASIEVQPGFDKEFLLEILKILQAL